MIRDRAGRPMTIASPLRRRLLKLAAASGMLAAIDRNVALAQSGPGYKALVCLNMQGGNDGENTLIRHDTAGYQAYSAVRNVASGINIAQSQLLPIQPARGGPAFGFHPSCAPLQDLFQRKQLAVIANMGMLVQPSSKSPLETQGAPRPANLFSHSDQELAIQSADASGFNRIGWGGRIADRLDGANPGTLFPPMISTNGLRTFVHGQASVPLTVPENPYFTLFGSGDNQYQFDALRDAALREMLAQSRSNIYDVVAKLYAEEGLAASSVVFPILQNNASVVTPIFGSLDTSVSRQLKTIAKLIEGRAQTNMKRQVFYVHQGSYDTHGSQLVQHQQLLGDMSVAVKAFNDAMVVLGLSNDVTLFTLSEFGRTLKPNNGGTDHGWGNYAFVTGGAVKGGDFYGTVPNSALNGPDDLGKDGRWIPTTSLEQYGATLSRWFGIAEGDLPYVFPNLGAFANSNVGFMR